MTYDLSILIPSRNEQFLSKTVEDILKNIRGKTEVIVVLDGQWANPAIVDDPRVTLIYRSESIGQRAATNEACRLSKAKWIIKCDAHCAFDEGFDVKMMKEMEGHDDWTMVPIMRNLHAFDWVCPDGHRRYQSPSGPCKDCGKETKQDVVWIAKTSPQSTAYTFDTTLHFQYHNQWKKKQIGDITETMSLQGSCWMLTRDKYWELNICDEEFGSWGQQGVEVACKTWLSGGRVVCNRKTWYAHMFRTQGGDFGFPYPISGRQVDKARKYSRDLFLNNKWDKQVRPLSWLIEKFKPLAGWHDDTGKEILEQVKSAPAPALSMAPSVDAPSGPTKGIIFYTDNQLPLKIAHVVQGRLRSIGLPIVSSSLKPMSNMGKNIYMPLKRGYLTMFKQILAALEASTADIIFFCEHDVWYSPSHFDFTPPTKDAYYYNINWWRLRLSDGFTVHWDANQVSGLCAYRDILINHYKKKVATVEQYGYNHSMGFEPGAHNDPATIATRNKDLIPKDIYVDDIIMKQWKSADPNVDIKHGNNLSFDKWSLAKFRDKSAADTWQEGYEIPGWGKTSDLISQLK